MVRRKPTHSSDSRPARIGGRRPALVQLDVITTPGNVWLDIADHVAYQFARIDRLEAKSCLTAGAVCDVTDRAYSIDSTKSARSQSAPTIAPPQFFHSSCDREARHSRKYSPQRRREIYKTSVGMLPPRADPKTRGSLRLCGEFPLKVRCKAGRGRRENFG
jgi:hypothetical protein